MRTTVQHAVDPARQGNSRAGRSEPPPIFTVPRGSPHDPRPPFAARFASGGQPGPALRAHVGSLEACA